MKPFFTIVGLCLSMVLVGYLGTSLIHTITRKVIEIYRAPDTTITIRNGKPDTLIIIRK